MSQCKECKQVWCEEIVDNNKTFRVEYNRKTNGIRGDWEETIDDCKARIANWKVDGRQSMLD